MMIWRGGKRYWGAPEDMDLVVRYRVLPPSQWQRNPWFVVFWLCFCIVVSVIVSMYEPTRVDEDGEDTLL